jgi:PKD repeat protein
MEKILLISVLLLIGAGWSPVSAALIADFNATPLSGQVPLDVQFNDLSTGNITGWLWYFGDGNSTNLQSPSHLYEAPGNYTVSLTVSNASESDIEERISYIIVTPQPPVAGFSATPLSGSAPLDVQFTDSSTGVVDNWLWTFGDGNTSIVANPLHTYASAGVYNVSLTVTNTGGSNTSAINDYISVSPPPPVANFTGEPRSGCVGLCVSFSDNSTGDPTSWQWDFGDGYTSSLKDLIHCYLSSPGTYNVTLTVNNTYGSDSLTRVNYITVIGPPVADFFVGPPDSGLPPLQVCFSDNSTGNPTSWLWDFGDGSTSPLSNPCHIYTSPGSYNVTLTVNNTCGSDSLTRANSVIVTNIPPVASFSANRTLGRVPLHVQFTNTSTGTGITNWNWDFGDGYGSPLPDPVHFYSLPGIYNVSLQVTNDGGSNTSVLTGYIRAFDTLPLADFTGEPQSGSAPLTVQFFDTSAGDPTSWTWDFGDGQISPLQSPDHTYANPGDYTVTLTVGNSGGTNTTIKPDYIHVSRLLPVAGFTGSPLQGVVPFQVNFTDQSTGTPTSWNWSFGDGSYSEVQNPSHTYSAAGDYTVNLTATNAYGSDTLSEPDYIQATEMPVANFTTEYFYYGRFYAYGGFLDTSTGNPTSWNWSFGDGYYSEYQNPWHDFEGVGSYDVTLTVGNSAGNDTITKEDFVVIPPPAPLADFSGSPRFGSFPLMVKFTDYSEGSIDWDTPPATYEWDFGDGSPNSTEKGTVYHNYMQAGTYTVTLTVMDIGGSDTLTYVNYIGNATPPEPIADFTATPKHGYAPLSVDFIDQTTGSPIISYAWAFGDGTVSTDKDPTHVYTTPGLYNVTLVATNMGGSSPVTKHEYIEVIPAPPGVHAEFTATPRSGTSPLSVDFIDQSAGTVLSWSWSFGDGATSSEKNPTHVYAGAGIYNVSLTVTDADGSSTKEKTGYIQVNAVVPLTADFTANTTTGTVPLDVQFQDTSTGSPSSWFWEFDDYYWFYENQISPEKNPRRVYEEPGNYSVTLTVSRQGETSTITKDDFIRVLPPPPVADFDGYPRSGNAPLAVTFYENVPYAWYYDDFLWDFGDGGTGEGRYTEHIYADQGLYNVTLTVSGMTGTNTTTKVHYINVTTPVPPVPDFTASPLVGNAPLNVTFSDTSSGIVTSRLWDFGDGTTEWSNSSSTISHIYPLPETYTVSLTAGNEGGQATATKDMYIQVNPSGSPPDARFVAMPLLGSAPMTVRFTDRSTGSPLAWKWNFGDGATSSEKNPSHTYTTAGRYRATLTVFNHGGSDSYSTYLWVRSSTVITPSPTITPTPTFSPIRERSPVAIFRTNSSFGSAPMSVQFTDLSFHNPDSWLWQFGDGQTSTLKNPVHLFTEPGTYSVWLTVTNEIGESSTSRRIYVT